MLAHLAEQPAAVPEMAFIFIVSGRDNITYSDYHVYIPNTYLLGSGRRPQRLPSSWWWRTNLDEPINDENTHNIK